MRTLLERLAEGAPIICDGGLGSELFARGVTLTNSTLANESDPETVMDVHADFIEAGAEIIEVNSFVASRLHMEMAGKTGAEADQIARLAVRHARRAAERTGRNVYIAGSMGPSPTAIEADSGNLEFGVANQVARDAHERLAHVLAEEGVDLFCVETMFSAKEAAMIVDVARQTDIPIAVNLTYKYTQLRRTKEVVYKTDWGHSAADLLEILASGEMSGGDDLLDAVHILGVNCGAEARRTEHTGMPYAINGIRQLGEAMGKRGIPPKRMMAYPNAGLPRLDANLQGYYTQTAEEMAAHVPELLDAGAQLIGGCCGASPDHIKALAQAARAHLDREPVPRPSERS